MDKSIVPVPVKLDCLKPEFLFSIKTSPESTVNFSIGSLVPIPTFPLDSSVILASAISAVVDAILAAVLSKAKCNLDLPYEVCPSAMIAVFNPLL